MATKRKALSLEDQVSALELYEKQRVLEKYQVLAVATDVKTKEESQNIKTGKKVASDWTFNIGEDAVDLKVVTFSGHPVLYVLGERNIFILTENGKLRFMKKLEYSPSSFCPYGSVAEGTVNCMIATHTNTLMIYQNTTLKWAAQLTRIPVQIRLAKFRNLDGVIVVLDEDGHLNCLFLGTDPAMFKSPSTDAREIDYTESDREMQFLQKEIKQHQSKAQILPTKSADDEVEISVQVPSTLDNPSLARDLEIEDPDEIPSITVKITVKARVHVKDIRLTISIQKPLAVNENIITFPALDPSRAAETQVTFYMKYALLPSSLQAEVTTNYLSSSGVSRLVQTGVKLPLHVLVKPALPVKSADFKVTVDTNKASVNLNEIFPALQGENAGGPGNVLGFQYYGTTLVVTVLASKTSQKYRLQCDSFAGLWMMLNELITRLHGYFLGRGQKDLKVSYDGSLPLQEYFDVLDRHFECRQEEEKLRRMLEERASQFRGVQRRLLTRFKDKTPAPLQNLDTLLDGTYRQLLTLADTMEDNRQIQEKLSSELGAATSLLNLLIKLWQNMSQQEFSVLQSALTPVVAYNGTQGWDEIVDAALTHLLRTSLSKNVKDQAVNPSPLTMLRDSTKLKKHIALLVDRLAKGARLCEDTDSIAGKPTKSKKLSQSENRSQRPSPSIRDSGVTSATQGDGLAEESVMEGGQIGVRRPTQAERTSRDTRHMTDRTAFNLDYNKPSDLPPLRNQNGELDHFQKKKPSIAEQVPDLDELEDIESESVPNSNQLIYDL